uniref:malic enzyme-like NAD(P)-binding protein n=1 Tax=Streptococcus dysgalactiae TaxID=1334 RepID=UPI003704894D
MSDEQKEFINDSTNVQNTSFKSLEEIVSEVQPTILIGTSTQPGAFNEQVVKTMSTYTERPIILPLSNPTKLAEAKAEDLLRWTNGKALIGTGIPVENIQYNGVEYQIGQANNALMYPGLGLGLIASKAQRVNKDILSQASHALGNLVDVDKPGAPILPPISKIESFSQKIAEDVAQAVIDQKLNGSISTYNVKDLVAHYKWQPIYESLLDK